MGLVYIYRGYIHTQVPIWERRAATRRWPLSRALQCGLELAEARSQRDRNPAPHLTPISRLSHASYLTPTSRHTSRHITRHCMPEYTPYRPIMPHHRRCATAVTKDPNPNPNLNPNPNQALRYCHDDAIPGFQLLHRPRLGRSNALPSAPAPAHKPQDPDITHDTQGS